MAQIEVLLVSEAKIKAFTSVNFNLDPSILKPYILQAQDLWVQNYIGSSFYDELRSQVQLNTLTADNRLFLETYLSQPLMNYALWKAFPFIQNQIFNKGIMRPTSATNETIAIEDMKFLRQEIMNTAMSYIQKAINFLRERPTLYPKYQNPQLTDGDGILPERGKISTNQITIPRYYGGSWNRENGCDSCYERNSRN